MTKKQEATNVWKVIFKVRLKVIQSKEVESNREGDIVRWNETKDRRFTIRLAYK